MAQRQKIENYNNIPITYVTNPAQYYPPVILPPKIINTYSHPATVYGYNTNGQYYQAQPIQIKTATANNNPHTIYYSNSQNKQAINSNNIKYITHLYTQGQRQNNKARKTVPVQSYQQIKETIPQIQRIPSREVDKNINNIVYNERKTNYPGSNTLNLNSIYNMQNSATYNTNKVNKMNEIKYYNNNMYMVESGNISNQKQNTQKIIQNNTVPNNYYNNSNSLNSLKTIQNIMPPQKSNMNNINANANKNNSNVNDNFKGNMLNKTKISTNNQVNIYLNNKIIINNKKVSNNNNANYLGYKNQQNLINNDKTINNFNYDGILQEPPDNPRQRARNKVDYFNNTMPNLKTKNDIAKGIEINTNAATTIERKSYPIQQISNFEISYKNIPKIENKNIISINQMQNNISLTTNNLNIANNINKQNVQTTKIINENNKQCQEYKDKYGNILVLINGKLVDKRMLANNITNFNQNTIIAQKINTNINNTQQLDINHQNKNKSYFSDYIQISNEAAYFDTYNGQVIKNQSPQIKIASGNKTEEINYNIININQIQQEINLRNNNKYNISLNNTYPLKGQKEYKNEYITNNNITQEQNVNLNQRNNRFKQEQNYIDINTNNNINYNINYIQQQQQQIINDNFYEKDNDGIERENEIVTVEPQKPKKRRPVYKIPPSKKRAVSQGRSLAFIHKYYDENFILEEDNEDNASDSENKKNQNNKLKNIFKEVTNIRRLIPKQEIKENNEINNNLEQNENNEEQDILDNFNKDNDNNVNLEQNLQNMRLSHIRFSLERSIITDEKSKDYNNDNNINNEEETKIVGVNNIKNEEQKKNEETDNIQNNIELNSLVKTSSGRISQTPSKDISYILDKENLNGSDISGPKNSDPIIDPRNSLEQISRNLENKNSQNFHKKLKNIDINKDIDDNIRGSNLSSIHPNFIDPRDNDIKDSLLNSNINLEGNQKRSSNIYVKNDNIEESEDKRISLNIARHQLDQYFQKEETNKRDKKEISISLKTVDENRNNQIITDNLNGEDQKICFINNKKSNNMINGNSKDENQLLKLDDTLKGNGHLSEKIQSFVSKNNSLYNDKNNSC